MSSLKPYSIIDIFKESFEKNDFRNMGFRVIDSDLYHGLDLSIYVRLCGSLYLNIVDIVREELEHHNTK